MGLSSSYDQTLDVVTLKQDSYWKTWLLQCAGVGAGDRVLDIGCGTGVLEERMGHAEVVGVDITEEMLRLAHEKGIASIRSLGLADGENLPFRDESFDCIVSCYVVKYCNPSRFVHEAARVLRPGGRFVLYDFSAPRGPFGPFHAMYVYGLLKIIGKTMQLFDSDTAYTYLALPEVIRTRAWDAQLEEKLRSAGFTGVGRRSLTAGVVTGFWATKP
jgi:demethylmenaquinone methyltransferase / 2-methoxy-6-polyprenyl-1,4-benzoquinol methylase